MNVYDEHADESKQCTGEVYFECEKQEAPSRGRDDLVPNSSLFVRNQEGRTGEVNAKDGKQIFSHNQTRLVLKQGHCLIRKSPCTREGSAKNFSPFAQQ